MLPPALNHVVADLQAVPAFPAETKFLSTPTSENKLVPSIIKPPELELKTLPEHLKYVFLGELNTLPVIISNKLTSQEEDRLVRVLRDNKEAIEWTIADIKGLSPSICMHRILLEDDCKPCRQP